MKPKYYFDTNIFLNFLWDEKNKSGIKLGNKAFKAFMKGISCNFEIIISSWTLYELKKKVSNEEIKNLMNLLKPKIIKVKHSLNEVSLAKKIEPSHYEDYLHVILAKKAFADAIITRDRGFLRYSIKVKLPEQIS